MFTSHARRASSLELWPSIWTEYVEGRPDLLDTKIADMARRRLKLAFDERDTTLAVDRGSLVGDFVKRGLFYSGPALRGVAARHETEIKIRGALAWTFPTGPPFSNIAGRTAAHRAGRELSWIKALAPSPR